MTGVICAIAGAGTAVLDQQTLTYGFSSSGSNPVVNYYGYKNSTPAIGSITDGTSNIYSGASITGIYGYEEGYSSPPVGYVTREIVFEVSGTVSNSGWTTMTIGTTPYNRADAAFGTGGGKSTWTWTVTIPNPNTSGAPGPFNSSGNTSVQWT